jgi:hypothetical protein
MAVSGGGVAEAVADLCGRFVAGQGANRIRHRAILIAVVARLDRATQ